MPEQYTPYHFEDVAIMPRTFDLWIDRRYHAAVARIPGVESAKTWATSDRMTVRCDPRYDMDEIKAAIRGLVEEA